MKRRVARFLTGTICPVCDGKRLKKEALSVTFAGLDIGELNRMPLSEVAALLSPTARGEHAAAAPAGGRQRLPHWRREDGEADIARRIAAGGSAHAGSSDVRRTPNLSEEKRLAA